MIKKHLLFSFILMLVSCSPEPIERAVLPTNDFLVIAHRGASAYAPDHTMLAYELAVQMEADYIELDLHMTKDNKLVALHDPEILLNGKKRRISNTMLEELNNYSPGAIYNEQYPEFASPIFEALPVPELGEILAYFKDEVNYYIEIKSPTITPGMEEELIRQLRAHHLLNRSDQHPKVIIQSYNAKSLKKVFQLEPSIPLIKLYSKKTGSLSKREIRSLGQYASGVGVNMNLVTTELIKELHKNGLHIHPFVVNDEKTIQAIKQMGVDGVFTDKPDIAVKVTNKD